jgi:hypothetical protein
VIDDLNMDLILRKYKGGWSNFSSPKEVIEGFDLWLFIKLLLIQI